MALITLLAAAVAGPPALAQDGKGPVVLAAASLQESMTAAADAWAARKHPRPVLSFAGSSALARQVEAGAPADLFVSADEDWMDYLAQRKLIRPGSRADLVGNALVLIAPKDSRITLKVTHKFSLVRALGKSGRLAMADPDAVPAGRYGKATLQSLGHWDAVAPRVARADNVRAALVLVERGEVPLGIVYATDARASQAVRIVGVFPAKSHPPIRYPVAVLARASHPDADAFRRFLLSRQGKAIFARYGFTPF